MISSIDIVIPVLDEAQTLEAQIARLKSFIEHEPELKSNYQITIADNGSTDNTLEIARELSKKHQGIRVVSVGKRGVGLALKAAWEDSKCEYVGYMDLDFSTDLHHLIDLECAVNKDFDCVFGSRLLPKSVVINRSFKRRITSKVFNAIIRLTFNSVLSDGMCGFKFLKRDNLNNIYRFGANCDGWFFCTEITIAAQLAGYNILEIPINWQDDKKSKVRIPSLTFEYIVDIIKFRRRIKASTDIRQNL